MEVILLERIAKLGQMGEVVRVKDGFARNFLLPQGKALRATGANKSKFEGMKVELEAKSAAAKGDADKVATKLDGKSFTRAAPGVRSRPALRLGVAARHRRRCSTTAATRSTATRSRSTFRSRRSAATRCRCMLHPEVEVTITLHVARSADEAERLARGEDVTVRRDGDARGGGGRGQGCGGSLLRARGAIKAEDEAAKTAKKPPKQQGRRRP